MNSEIQTGLRQQSLIESLEEEQSEAPTRSLAETRQPEKSVKRIVIASTFTADPIEEPLRFWMDALDIPAEIALSPYAQLMQQLLDPDSLTARNASGFNVLVIRVQDWIRDRASESVESNVAHLHRAASDFIAALMSARRRTSAVTVVFLCASSTAQPEGYGKALDEVSRGLAERLRTEDDIAFYVHEDLMRLYPVLDYEDQKADQLAHIPYTNDYFAAMATWVARTIAQTAKPRHKVIAIDCDNTLWSGVCGEDGATGVVITPQHIEFQRMLVRQHDAGMLLCLCSKNNEIDVRETFLANADMPLREEHVISSRINWSSKSSNLLSLAEELGLSLDAFVLVDDSPAECAEVQANCPSVLVLEFPSNVEEIPEFLAHVWAFDNSRVTEDAKQRTDQYRQNAARRQALEQTSDLKQFLASLELRVDVQPLSRGQLTRVAELINRTNQFNLTAIRRSESELDALWRRDAIQCLVVHVADRFGDYGLVGAVLYQETEDAIDVETFVLSCRVLGRGVEHRIVNELARIARRGGRHAVTLGFRDTSRNAPAQAFLETSFDGFARLEDESSGSVRYVIPVGVAEALTLDAAAVRSEVIEVPRVATSNRAPGGDWHHTAYRYRRMSDLMKKIGQQASSKQRRRTDRIAPRTAIEEVVAGTWARVLRLQLQALDVRDNFFDVGGDSVRAVRIISELTGELDVDLSIYEFFEKPTVEGIAARLTESLTGNSAKFDPGHDDMHTGTQRPTPALALDTAKLIELTDSEIAAVVKAVPGGGQNLQNIYPLLPLQEGLLFHHLMNQRNDTYIISIIFELQSFAKIGTLISALQSVVDRFDALRTAVLWEEVSEPVQVVYRRASVPVDGLVLEAERDPLEQLKERAGRAGEGIDPRHAPLLRLQIASDPRGSKGYAVLRVHHLVCDHESLKVLVQETLARIEGEPQESAPPAPYGNYVEWSFAQAKSHDPESFFRKQLGDISEPTAPFGLTEAGESDCRIEESDRLLPASLAARIRERARHSGVSAARLFHVAWGVVIARTSGLDDVVFGTVLQTQQPRGAQGRSALGMFVNTLPLRVRIHGCSSAELLAQTHQDLMELSEYAHCSLTLARRCSGIAGTMPLLTSLLNYRYTEPTQELARERGHGVRVIGRNDPWTNYPIALTVDDYGDEFRLKVKTDGRIDPVRVHEYVETALDSLSAALHSMPQSRAASLAVLPATEYQRITREFNLTERPVPTKQIHELFEEQVQRSPDAVAVVSKAESLTYLELNRRANQLARFLIERGAGPDQLVAILLERGIEMIVGILGTLKAGAAYVPLDPTNPVERLEYIVGDARAGILLTQRRFRNMLSRFVDEVVSLDTEWEKIAAQAAEDLSWTGYTDGGESLAYVIYTSGSTGKPKGVMVAHRNVVNYATHALRQFDVSGGSGSLMCTSISFDLVLTGLYPVLLGGRTVHLCGEQHGLPTLTEDLLRLKNLAPLKLTPSHLSLLDGALQSGQLADRVRVLVLGGEALSGRTVQSWRKHAPGTRIFNHYGPTETTVGAVVHELKGTETDVVPIGSPIANTRIYILDPHRQVLPVGVVGEIFIGGGGVARGYFQRPDLTAEKFTPDPFSATAGARMYSTGDLGRWQADGTMEYLGRRDHQVKIRGFRIELAEIEAQLARHGQVKDALVLAREDIPGDRRLVAYVTLRTGVPESIESLRMHMKAVLPEYMIPSAFVVLQSLPLTPNGKVDRRALPAPSASVQESNYEAPRGELELALADIWQSLLHIPRVGRLDSFFELGGHSLLIVQMKERLRQLGMTVEVRDIFESDSLAKLAECIAIEDGSSRVAPNLIPAGCTRIVPKMLPLVVLKQEDIDCIASAVPDGAANIQDIYPLSPLQQGLLFHHLMDEHGGDAYLVPVILTVSSWDGLQRLIGALQSVIDRHDILRTAVLWENLPQAVQVVYRRATLPVASLALDSNLDPLEELRQLAGLQEQRLDLRCAPLMRLQVAEAGDGQWYVLLQTHHVTSDHVAWEVVISEVVAHLKNQEKILPNPLPYRNHVAQALMHARKKDSEAFFREKLGDLDQPTMPFGLLNAYGDGTRLTEAREDIPTELARRIRVQARLRGVTPATLFHAAWSLVVAQTTGRDDVVFGSVLLGRMHAAEDAQRTLGMFINTLPLRIRLRDLTAGQLVGVTHTELVELFTHEQASLAVAQRCSGIAGGSPLFTALFNYRHSALDIEAELGSVPGIRVLGGVRKTNYPVTFSVDDLGDGFRLVALTDFRINPARVAGYLHTAIRSLLDALERAPETSALSLPILPENELRAVVEGFNATQAVYPQIKLVHQLFEKQAERRSNAVAVSWKGRQLTYSDLNRHANQLAHHLRGRGVKVGENVPVIMPRCLTMLIAQLAVMKCGAVYVPVDPLLPQERQQFIVRDCGSRRALIEAGAERLESATLDWIECSEETGWLSGQPHENLDLAVNAPAAAYVMYTSGSTGQPKGVIVPHHSINRLVLNTSYVQISDEDCIAHCSNPAFDASTFEVWGALLNGARLLIVPHSIVLGAEQFAAELTKERVTILWLTMGLFAQYAETLGIVFQQLRYFLTGGEAVDPGVVQRVLRRGPPQCFLCAYGPTECTTFSTTYRIERIDESGVSVPIGRPISNAQAYILDERLRPVPIGVTGEIYIGGDGLAMGYLNRPGLTAERFVPNPFDAAGGARLYKSGDLARWQEDGIIEFVGRNDQQVKLRGFRIELEEIEAALTRHAQVKEAIVLAREDVPGDKRLVAYVVPDREAVMLASSEGEPEQLRSEIVSEWETIYQEIYGAPDDAGPTFVGWESSYTGRPIPESEMQEWLAHTVERVLALNPTKVLEIGCGVGLVLQHVAPRCETYVGTDFSAAAIEKLRRWVRERDELSHVELMQRSATELQGLPSGSFDLVILNSVVQYFPDIDYLAKVLQDAIRLLGPRGKIFLGDVRHLGSLRTLHSAVQLGRAGAMITAGQLRRRVDRAVAHDKELVIDPDFFSALRDHMPEIRGVSVQFKRGDALNELTRYRFDAVLDKADDVHDDVPEVSISWQAVGGSLESLEAALAERRCPSVRVKEIPNARLTKDLGAQRLIETSDERTDATTLREQLKASTFAAVEPEALWALAQRYDYQIAVRPGASGQFDVDLTDRRRVDEIRTNADRLLSLPRPWSAYANDPLEAGVRQQLIPRLRDYVKQALPEYMVPSAWMLLRQLPLTRNGKVDRRAFPAPQSRPEELGEYVAPGTELERALADIWAQLLRVDQVGVHDNFFELGGHSLLALQVLSRINQHFGCSLRVTDAYKNPTVRGLAQRISRGTEDEGQIDLMREAVLSEDLVAATEQCSAVPKAILLTGATGFVGRFLVWQLLQETDAVVYCLVRAPSVRQALTRLVSLLKEWDLWQEDFAARLIAVPGDLRQPQLGISSESFNEIAMSVDHIYHCATSMNHLETYSMAKQANVGSAVELVKLATLHKRKLINFVSTLGVFSSATTQTSRIVNERTPIEQERHAESRGYVASKWVGEKIFMLANERGIPCNIFRLGLVWADSKQGRYDDLQREYRVLKSCLLSGIGITDYVYAWPPTPADYVARAVVFLGTKHHGGNGVFHISSSEHQVSGLFEHCNEMLNGALKLLPLYEWIQALKQLHELGESVPIVPLIEYAFSMDEVSFHESQRRAQSSRPTFDSSSTHRELARAGIETPVVTRAALRLCLTDMVSRDEDLDASEQVLAMFAGEAALDSHRSAEGAERVQG